MADYNKKVIYLSYLEEGNRIKGAGFIKTEVFGNKWAFDMRVSGMQQLTEKKYDICVADWKGKEYQIGSIFLHKGNGEWKESGEGSPTGMDGLPVEQIRRFVIRLSDTKVIEGDYQTLPVTVGKEEERREEKKEFHAAEKVHQERAEKKNFLGKEKDIKAEEESLEPKEKTNREMLGGSREKEVKMDEMILNDKWEQLCQMYPVVHPYEDDRKYISIQPKDFVVMTGDYQHLANNSFLLHGFYNYRHIILGREPSNQTGGDFFLGVPGVYYEREKMVALMFGFEAFECCGGKAEPGKFGYYLRRVKI